MNAFDFPCDHLIALKRRNDDRILKNAFNFMKNTKKKSLPIENQFEKYQTRLFIFNSKYSLLY